MTPFSGSADTRLRVETITDGETTRVVIHGEADVADVNHLDAALTRIQLDGTRSVQIDASNLDFFDVAVLRLFAQRVGRPAVTSPPAEPRRCCTSLRACSGSKTTSDSTDPGPLVP